MLVPGTGVQPYMSGKSKSFTTCPAGQVSSENYVGACKSIVKKIFDGEMLIRSLPTTLLEIFCKIMVISKVILKSIIDPDDNCWRNI